MGSLRRRLVFIGEEAAPRGRVTRMRLRVTVDLLITLVLAAIAVASATAYQLIVNRKPGRRSSWL
jgi:hypothetical protein